VDILWFDIIASSICDPIQCFCRNKCHINICKWDLCLVTETIERYPQFLVFEVNEQQSHDEFFDSAFEEEKYEVRPVEKSITVGILKYELICTIHNTGRHFICYAELPQISHVPAGLYRYDDFEDKAYKVDIFWKR
jgi:hypothetical protein